MLMLPTRNIQANLGPLSFCWLSMLHPDVWIWIIFPQEIQPPLFSPSLLSLHAVLSLSPSVCSFECCTFYLVCLHGLSSLQWGGDCEHQVLPIRQQNARTHIQIKLLVHL